MPYINPFTDEELSAAARVPLTREILLHGQRIGTAALSQFGFQVMERVFQRQLSLTDRETVIRRNPPDDRRAMFRFAKERSEPNIRELELDPRMAQARRCAQTPSRRPDVV